MFQNVGGIDRILRVLVVAILVAASAMNVLPVWGYIGIIPLATGLAGWCPLYLPFGIRTCRRA